MAKKKPRLLLRLPRLLLRLRLLPLRPLLLLLLPRPLRLPRPLLRLRLPSNRAYANLEPLRRLQKTGLRAGFFMSEISLSRHAKLEPIKTVFLRGHIKPTGYFGQYLTHSRQYMFDRIIGLRQMGRHNVLQTLQRQPPQ